MYSKLNGGETWKSCTKVDRGDYVCGHIIGNWYVRVLENENRINVGQSSTAKNTKVQ